MKLTAYAHSLDSFGELKSRGFEHVALHPMLFPGLEMGMLPSEETIEAVKTQLATHHLEPTDLVTFNAWNVLGLSGSMEQLPSSPKDPQYEMARKRGVTQFAKMIKVCKRFGAKQIYSQLGGRPLYHYDHEEAWTKSVKELDPVLQEEGIQLAFMPHPGDFIEESDVCVDMIQKAGCKNVKYIFVAPHSFVMAGRMEANPGAMVRYAAKADLLSEVHMADSIKPVQAWIRDHLDISAIHSHLVPGKGFVDIEGILGALVEVDFQGPMIMIPYRYGISDKSFVDLAAESKQYVEAILAKISKK